MERITASELAKRLNGKRAGSGWQARCPAHDDEKPSLSISEKPTNGESPWQFLIHCHAGCSKERVLSMLREKGILGNKLKLDNPWKQIWRESEQVDKSARPVWFYLKNRGFNSDFKFKSLRFNPKTYYKDEITDTTYFPALICAVKNFEGDLIAIQRVFVTEDGKKAPVQQCKKALGPISGGSVHLGKVKDTLNIVEGVETGLAVYEGTSVAVWAALTAINLVKLIVPDKVKTVHIWADKDESGNGQTSANKLAERLRAERKTVFVHLPHAELGKGQKSIDWLDELNSRGPEFIHQVFKEGNTPELKSVVDSESEWPTPQDFNAPDLPKLPLEALPKAYRNLVTGVSKSLGVCHNLPYMHVLGVLSVACTKAFRIQLKHDFSQPANLYLLAPIGTSERKSDTLKLVFAPVYKWQSNMAEKMKDEIKKAQRKHSSLQTEIEILQKKFAKKDSERETITQRIEKLEDEIPKIPVAPLLTVTDVTPERTAALMAEQFERIAFVEAEGAMFANITGRYSKGVPNYDIFLSGHSEDHVHIQRKTSKEDIILHKPAITFCMSPQPKVVQDLAKAPGVAERGFLGRFLYCYPQPMTKREWDTPKLSDEVKDIYQKAVFELIDFSYNHISQEDYNPICLTLSKDAERRFRAFHDTVVERTTVGGRLYPISDWAGKLVGATGRIVLLLHVAKNVTDWKFETREVDEVTVRAAVKIAKVICEHALYAYEQMATDPESEKAKLLIKWIRHNKITKFSKKKCHERFRSQFKKVEELGPALEILQNRKIIRLEERVEKTKGRPSEVYLVNPKFLPAND